MRRPFAVRFSKFILVRRMTSESKMIRAVIVIFLTSLTLARSTEQLDRRIQLDDVPRETYHGGKENGDRVDRGTRGLDDRPRDYALSSHEIFVEKSGSASDTAGASSRLSRCPPSFFSKCPGLSRASQGPATSGGFPRTSDDESAIIEDRELDTLVKILNAISPKPEDKERSLKPEGRSASMPPTDLGKFSDSEASRPVTRGEVAALIKQLHGNGQEPLKLAGLDEEPEKKSSVNAVNIRKTEEPANTPATTHEELKSMVNKLHTALFKPVDSEKSAEAEKNMKDELAKHLNKLMESRDLTGELRTMTKRHASPEEEEHSDESDEMSCRDEAKEHGHTHIAGIVTHEFMCELKKLYKHLRTSVSNLKEELSILIQLRMGDDDVLLQNPLEHVQKIIEALANNPERIIMVLEIIQESIPYSDLSSTFERLKSSGKRFLRIIYEMFVELDGGRYSDLFAAIRVHLSETLEISEDGGESSNIHLSKPDIMETLKEIVHAASSAIRCYSASGFPDVIKSTRIGILVSQIRSRIHERHFAASPDSDDPTSSEPTRIPINTPLQGTTETKVSTTITSVSESEPVDNASDVPSDHLRRKSKRPHRPFMSRRAKKPIMAPDMEDSGTRPKRPHRPFAPGTLYPITALYNEPQEYPSADNFQHKPSNVETYTQSGVPIGTVTHKTTSSETYTQTNPSPTAAASLHQHSSSTVPYSMNGNGDSPYVSEILETPVSSYPATDEGTKNTRHRGRLLSKVMSRIDTVMTTVSPTEESSTQLTEPTGIPTIMAFEAIPREPQVDSSLATLPLAEDIETSVSTTKTTTTHSIKPTEVTVTTKNDQMAHRPYHGPSTLQPGVNDVFAGTSSMTKTTQRTEPPELPIISEFADVPPEAEFQDSPAALPQVDDTLSGIPPTASASHPDDLDETPIPETEDAPFEPHTYPSVTIPPIENVQSRVSTTTSSTTYSIEPEPSPIIEEIENGPPEPLSHPLPTAPPRVHHTPSRISPATVSQPLPTAPAEIPLIAEVEDLPPISQSHPSSTMPSHPRNPQSRVSPPTAQSSYLSELEQTQTMPQTMDIGPETPESRTPLLPKMRYRLDNLRSRISPEERTLPHFHRYKGYDVGIHEREYPDQMIHKYPHHSPYHPHDYQVGYTVDPTPLHVMPYEKPSTAAWPSAISRCVSFGRVKPPFALPRDKIAASIGRDQLRPGDVVVIGLHDKIAVYGRVYDRVSPITFNFLKPNDPPSVIRSGGTIWNLIADDFYDPDCETMTGNAGPAE